MPRRLLTYSMSVSATLTVADGIGVAPGKQIDACAVLPSRAAFGRLLVEHGFGWDAVAFARHVAEYGHEYPPRDGFEPGVLYLSPFALNRWTPWHAGRGRGRSAHPRARLTRQS